MQAIPFNLNDLERITGGNMMVRPELPYSPGMEVMGVVDACGDGAEDVAGPARRRDAEGRARRLRRVRDLPGGVGVRHARRRSRCPTRPRSTSRSISRGSGSSTAPTCRRARACSSTRPRAAPGRPRSSSRSTRGARVFATAGTDEKVQLCRELGADVAINYNDADFAEVVLAETGNRGVDVVFDNVGEAVMEKSLQCTAYNGRYLMMGFASNKVVADEPFIVPRRIALGNFKLCGVLLAYAAPEMAEMVKTAMGWNFATGELGAADHARDRRPRASPGKVKPVVGRDDRLRRDPRRDRGDGEPRDDRPHDRRPRHVGSRPAKAGEGVVMTEPNVDIVIDCADPETLAEFWAEALGYTRPASSIRTSCCCRANARTPARDAATGARTEDGKARIHFDLRVPDIEAEAQRLEALGARRIDIGQGDDPGWITMADPEGNEFCVCPGVPLPAAGEAASP